MRPIFWIGILGLVIYGIYQWMILPFFFPSAKILHMIDADSLIVREGGKIKLVQMIGADAPELTGALKGHQCYDKKSLTAAASYFKTNRDIKLTIDGKAGEKDSYGRALRYVYLPDGAVYNEKLIKDGLAKESNPQNTDYKLKSDFLKAQEEAKAKGLGIWNAKECNGKF